MKADGTLSGRAAHLMMIHAVKYAYRHTGVRCRLSPDTSVFEGSVTDEYGIVTDAVVGIRECVSSDRLPYLYMTAGIVSIMHETMGHCNQILNMFHETDSLSKALAMNHFACKASDEYQYGKNGRQYFRQPKEIAAQYVGIKCGYDVLTDAYGNQEANRMICDYVNYRIRQNSEFIGFRQTKPYTTVDDILKAFQNVFEKRVYEHRSLSGTRAKEELSPYAFFFSENNMPSCRSYLSRCMNGAKQDLMLASIYFYQEDKNDRYRGIYQALEDVPPSPASAMSSKHCPQWILRRDRDMKLARLTDYFENKELTDELSL